MPMDKISFIPEIKHYTHSLVAYFIFEGIILVILGGLVVFYPGLLILIAAFFFILIGLASLWIGWKIYRFVKKIDKFVDIF